MGYGNYDDANWDNRAGVSRRPGDTQNYEGNRLDDQQDYEDEYQNYDGRQLYYRSRPTAGQQTRGTQPASRRTGGTQRQRPQEQERMADQGMRNRNYQGRQGNEDDWAREVRQNWQQGPYSDYGWESGESVLPEFRDPSVHRMPYEEEGGQEQRGQGQRRQGRPDFRRAYDAENAQNLPTGEMPIERGYGGGYARQEWWNASGPHTGRGPRGYQRSNERIREDVNDRLTQYGHLDATEIEVRVENGEVYLTGSVDDRRSKRMAEDLAESVTGVRDVHNELRVRSQSWQGKFNQEQGQSGQQTQGQRSQQQTEGQPNQQTQGQSQQQQTNR